MTHSWKRLFLAVVCSLAPIYMVGCGSMGAGGGDSAASDLGAAVYQDVAGVIKSDTGSSTELVGWIIAFIERDSAIARTGTVDVLGNYRISSLAVNRPQTIALLNTSYHLEAVLSMVGTESNKIHQFFTITGATVPTLVHNGSVVTFVDPQSLSFTTDLASDANGNGIPDGMDGTLRLAALGRSGLHLLDGSGSSINYNSPDINGDGLINVLDPDANGNGILDIFDPDICGDGVENAATQVHFPGSQYFPEGFDWLAVQVTQQMLTQGIVSTLLQISVKIQPGIVPSAVRVEGASALLSGAKSVAISATSGAQTTADWDGTLADDGANQDGVAGDGLYGRLIALDGVKTPKANQLIFIVLETNENGVVMVRKYPYMFSAIKAGTITGSWVKATRTMTLGGTLFTNFATGTAITDFKWSLHLFNSSNVEVFSSDPVPGTTNYYVVPASYLDTGATYTAYLAARSLAKIAGYPAWVLKSVTIPLQ